MSRSAPPSPPPRPPGRPESSESAAASGPAPLRIPAPALLVVAVLAISSSAVLVRWAEAPAESLALWRTAGGALILAPAARRAPARPRGRVLGGVVVAGLALAVHFATWLASLELTSVAASVTLVATAPLFVALGWTALGRRPPAATWVALGLALAGTAVITGGDALGVGATSPTALRGDALALIGAATVGLYLLVGDRVRSSLSTASYAAPTYAVAAGSLLVWCLATGVPLTGYDRTTWLAIAAMVLGPQLAGHTVLNLLLERLGSVSVSLALLLEPIGAGALVWLLFGEVPPLGAWVGGPLVLVALALQIRAGDGRTGGSGGSGAGG